MGFTFDIELHTEQPFIIDLKADSHHSQTIEGAIVIQMDRAEHFKVATVGIHGHVGLAFPSSTKTPIVYERLIETHTDLVAANDADGKGRIEFHHAGTHHIPFRIDLPRARDLPPTMINRLDTHEIDWKYEIHATLKRDFMLSSTRTVKHELIIRRQIVPRTETTATLSASTDMPKKFRSKLSAPSRVSMGQDKLRISVDMKARDKLYMVKEIDCAIVQTEEINYVTKQGHPSVEEAHAPGVPFNVNASRLVSAHKKVSNDDNDMDFGRYKPIHMDIHLDNFQLIPTDRGLSWLDISQVIRFTVHFMDVNLEPIVTELPLFVDHEDFCAIKIAELKGAQQDKSRLVESLKIAGTDEDHHSMTNATPATP
ncbi:hypothetical protein BGZ97_007654 [Linnemannia gamsii]|uniref:Uncharacterized protein n=1 Tax=Linnemannia gamsii TaxID=64522 RepID=A0A9P6REM6_9FUNG|nr:hypothetical protein BGZ97_007654 [Linnemannia gamsii]